MGFIESEERRRLEIEEFKRLALVGVVSVKKEDDDFKESRSLTKEKEMDEDVDEKIVCVTSGVSFLGLAIVNRLLLRGYFVRIILDNQDDVEKLRELEKEGGGERNSKRIKTIMAELSSVESLCNAFEGCRGIFHTSAFGDPGGLSGYTKSMSEMEVKASENVMEACSRTPSVRYCVFTSSLLACIWQNLPYNYHHTINHDSWSDDFVCEQKKLWYALGKLRAEKAAWRLAKEKGIKLATICSGFITGQDFFQRNPTASVAYLKGAREMFAKGLLAIADVMKVAEAHACVFEAMKKTAYGRYLCFDHIIQNEGEAARLAMAMDLSPNKIHGDIGAISTTLRLSNNKLFNLMPKRTLRTCYSQS